MRPGTPTPLFPIRENLLQTYYRLTADLLQAYYRLTTCFTTRWLQGDYKVITILQQGNYKITTHRTIAKQQTHTHTHTHKTMAVIFRGHQNRVNKMTTHVSMNGQSRPPITKFSLFWPMQTDDDVVHLFLFLLLLRIIRSVSYSSGFHVIDSYKFDHLASTTEVQNNVFYSNAMLSMTTTMSYDERRWYRSKGMH